MQTTTYMYQRRNITGFKRCVSKIYLRSDTVFLQHFQRKGRSNATEEREAQRKRLKKQTYVARQQEYLKHIFHKRELVPLRCVISQIGKENVKLYFLKIDYFESMFSILKNDPYVQYLDLSSTKLNATGSRLLSDLTRINRNITSLILENCDLNGDLLECFTTDGCFKNITILSLAGDHTCLQNLDLSWNHIRRNGAIDIARAVKVNTSLQTINLAWNGFGYEGCSALSDALESNKYLKNLDISSNRIHPPALLELLKGLTQNCVLQSLDISHNPITPPYTSIFLKALFETNMTGLTGLTMKKIIVDQDFPLIVKSIQQERDFKVTFEAALPLSVKPEKLRIEVQPPVVFNMDPLRLLYMLKEKNRAQDFFRKINKDNDDVLTSDEIQALFREMDVPVTRSVVEKIMEFMDTDHSGTIDLGEFLEGDKRMRKMSRDHARTSRENQEYNKHSRSFARGRIDPMTFQLKVEESRQLLPPIQSCESSRESSILK